MTTNLRPVAAKARRGYLIKNLLSNYRHQDSRLGSQINTSHRGAEDGAKDENFILEGWNMECLN